MNLQEELKATAQGSDRDEGNVRSLLNSRKVIDDAKPLIDEGQPTAESSTAAGAVNAGHLIRIEGELRNCTTREMLWQHLVNESGVLLSFGQALVLELHAGPVAHWQVEAISSLSEVQHDAPMVLWYQRLVDNLWAETKHSANFLAFELPRFADSADPCTTDAALSYLLWLPLVDTNAAIGAGWLIARSDPWQEHQVTLAKRLAHAYAHGASAIAGRTKPARPWQRQYSRIAVLAALLCALLGLVKVPLTTLAPVEVVPQSPFVVAAPVAGVVDRILVKPGTQVETGDPLVQLVDTALRSEYEVAQQKLEVARAKMLRFQQASISDSSAKRELAIAQSEAHVASAERDYAEAMLGKSVIKAPQPGVALYGDPRDWVGRPVAVGEAIMEVANPQQVEFEVKVPVADAVNLRDGAQAKIFLDAAPLEPIDAKVIRAAYKAEVDPAGIASFTVTARAQENHTQVSRLGLRGTARVYGEQVSLFYYLFRRPIVALRQWSGI